MFSSLALQLTQQKKNACVSFFSFTFPLPDMLRAIAYLEDQLNNSDFN